MCSVAALVGYTIVALVLAMLGVFDALLAAVLAVPLVVLAWRPIVSLAPRGGRDRWAALALVVVLASFGWSSTRAGQHLLIERDPASYLNTARWLERDGSLHITAANEVLDASELVHYEGAAVYLDGDQLEFQFNHGAATVDALAYDVAGARGLFAMPAAAGSLGLLAMYLVMRPFLRRGAIAVAAVTALAVSLPFLFATRDTYSEPFVLAIVWSVVAAFMQLRERARMDPGVLAFVGVLAGASCMFRVDALMYVAAACVMAAVVRAAVPAGRGWVWFGVAALVPVVVGLLDIVLFATSYGSDLADEISLLAAVVVMIGVAALAVDPLRRRSTLLASWIEHGSGARAARTIAGAVSALFLAGWLVRPHLGASRGDWSIDSGYAGVVASIQQAEHLAVSPLRSYAELTLESMGWYFGIATVALAVIGTAAVVHAAMSAPRSAAMVFALAAAVCVPLYLVRPSITPDQLWMTRRFLPFVIPSLVVVAAIGADRLVSAAGTVRVSAAAQRSIVAVATVIGAGLLVVPTARATWPIRDLAAYRGQLGAFETTCTVVGRSTVLEVGNGAMAMPIRAWCGVHAGIVAEDDATDAVRAIAPAATATCAPVWLVSRSPFVDGTLELLDRTEVLTFPTTTNVEVTLDRAPNHYRDLPLTIYVGRLALGASCAVD